MSTLRDWLLFGFVAALIYAAVNGGSIAPPFNPPPIDGPGLSVLIVEETADRGKIGKKLEVITSTKIRQFLKDHNGEIKVLDDDFAGDDWKFETEKWKKAAARAKDDAKGSLPWWLVSNGKRGESKPVPDGEDAALAVLQTYTEGK